MRGWSTLSTAGLLLAVMAAVPSPSSERPMDYVAQGEGRSQAVYPELVREQLHLPTSTGAEIYVEVTRPDSDAYPELRVPVILHASPYNAGTDGEDRSGTHLVLEAVDENGVPLGMDGYFSPRGYAWMSVDLRGTGYSSGCFDHLGPNDQQDLAEIVAWAAGQPWSNGRVGTIGHSYDGFTALATAAVSDRVVSAVVSAGGASLYDHQFQKGVPFLAQWAGTSVYPAIASTRYLRSGDEDKKVGHECGYLSGSALDGPSQVTGQMGPWHHARDHRETLGARRDVDVFVAQGLDDTSIRASAMEWFLTDREPSPNDHLWLGPWHHSEPEHLNGRPGQWLGALHAWFDRTLQQRDVSTGPAIEAFFDDGTMVVLDQWRAAPAALVLYPDADDMTLRFDEPGPAATVAFTANGNSDGARRVVNASPSLVGGSDPMPEVTDGGLDFTSPPLDHDATVVGLPRLTLRASVTGEIVHLVTTLYRIDEAGEERLLNTCAIQPQLRNGIETLEPVVPGEVMDLPLQCFATSHRLAAGDRLRLHVGTGSIHHIGTFSADARIEVVTGPDTTAYRLPARPDLTVYEAPSATGS